MGSNPGSDAAEQQPCASCSHSIASARSLQHVEDSRRPTELCTVFLANVFEPAKCHTSAHARSTRLSNSLAKCAEMSLLYAAAHLHGVCRTEFLERLFVFSHYFIVFLRLNVTTVFTTA